MCGALVIILTITPSKAMAFTGLRSRAALIHSNGLRRTGNAILWALSQLTDGKMPIR
jgi:hypothetical protein